MIDLSLNEMTLIGGLVAFGVIVGICCGRSGVKPTSEISSPAAVAFLIAGGIPMLCAFVATAIEAVVAGRPLLHALLTGVAACFILSFSVPWISGIPAVIAAALANCVMRRTPRIHCD